MKTAVEHTVLIVDDEEQVAKVIAGMLKKMGVKFIYAGDGEIALEKIRHAPKPFSVIISDQRMPGITGYELLEKAREMAPDTIRFLLTGHADIQALVDAVNRGAIHQYLSKPWDSKEFMTTVARGLKDYEKVLENKRLMLLAKEQNLKLYKLNKDLKEKADTHKKNLAILDRKIKSLKTRADGPKDGGGSRETTARASIETLFREHGLETKETINTFFASTLRELYEEFQDIATLNGFEMPDNP